MTIPYLISIDPASSKAHAVAFFSGGKLVALGLREVEGLALPDPCRVVIEDQYAGRNGGSVIKLARAAGHAAGRLHRSLEEVRWASPLEWKRAVAPGRKSPKTKRLEDYEIHLALLDLLGERERTVYQLAIDSVRSQVAKQDLCDAVGIGLWALDRGPTPGL